MVFAPFFFNNTLNRQISFTVEGLDIKGLFNFTKNCATFCEIWEKNYFI